ncbi:MAG: hypothetical protein P4L40_19285 [Terracidiphilus sp.]|nr:hypothetical protein [Terracidiphilus sp.]
MSILQHETVHGSGGPLWWIDKSGGRPWSDIAPYAFNLLPNDPNPGDLAALKGSYLLSAPFQVNTGQALTVVANIATAGYPSNCYNDVGFAVLLHNGKTKYVLFALRPDNVNRFGDTGPGTPLTFAPPTQPAGVTSSSLTTPFTVILNGINYAEGFHSATPATAVTSVCTPDAGSYQLLCGMFTGYPVDPTQPSAVVLWSAAVA